MEPATVTTHPVPPLDAAAQAQAQQPAPAEAAASIAPSHSVAGTVVDICGERAGFRYATDPLDAAAALSWVAEVATESRLHGGAVFGIDIETTSLFPHDGRIRLVQIAAGDRCVVLDAFAFDPWAVIREHAALPETLWTAHNAQFEQSWLGHHAGFTLLPMFDTRWVHVRNRALRTGVIAPSGSSLATVCEQLLDFPLSKEERLSDWSTQPLSDAQLKYAALDALVLIRLREQLERDVIDGGWQHEVAVSLRHTEADARRHGRPPT
ncbi:MAG: hypothetical protein WAP35_10975 [Solirubrobacterales bacterium]